MNGQAVPGRVTSAGVASLYLSDFGGLEVACWPLVPKFVGSHPAEAVGFLGRKKFLRTPSFGREVKPWVPYRSFTACKRSLNVTCNSIKQPT
jgi:hypothetical protein